MAVSLAAVAVLRAEAGFDLARDAAFVAGHSLGEYSALAAAGSIRSRRAARLLRLRGEAMQEAVPVGEGAMAALLGVEPAAAAAIAAEASARGVCDVANDNGGGQVVVSGPRSPSSGRWRSPRGAASSARSCCRCRRRSIAR